MGYSSTDSTQEEASLEQPSDSIELIIEGAGCASCVGKIEGALTSVTGVQQAEMNFATRTVSVSG